MHYQFAYPPILQTVIDTALQSYSPYIWLVIFTVIIGLLILFLISRIFKSPDLEAKVNVEFHEIIYSFIVVFITIGIIMFGDVITSWLVKDTYLQAFTSDKVPSAIEVSRGVMMGFSIDIYKVLLSLYYMQNCYGFKNGIYKRLGDSVFSLSYKIYPGSDMFISLIDALSLPLGMTYASINAQMIILYFDELIIPYLILPAGILFRFIPGGTYRNVGSFLLAVSVAGLVVFPMVYVIASRGLLDILHPDDLNKPLFPIYNPSLYGVGSGWLASMFMSIYQCGGKQFLLGMATNFLYLLGKIPGIGAVFSGAAKVITPFTLNSFTVELTNPVIFWYVGEYIALVFATAIFVPTLATILATSFISTYTRFLNGIG